MLLFGYWSDTKLLSKLVLVTSIALAIAGLVFVGSYYFDRYVHFNDVSEVKIRIAHLENLVKENPGDLQARLSLAQLYYENGMFQPAIQLSQEVLRVYPNDNSALLILGVSYLAEGKNNLAVKPLEKFVENRRRSSTAFTDNILEAALYYLGECYLKLNRRSDAIVALKEAITINPTDADAIFLLGQAYAQNGQPSLAVDQYHQAIRFDPDFLEAYAGLIKCYDILNMPFHKEYALGMYSYVEGDFERAKIYLERAITALDTFAPAYLGLGLLSEQLKDFDAARVYLSRVLELEPANFLAAHALGRIGSQGK